LKNAVRFGCRPRAVTEGTELRADIAAQTLSDDEVAAVVTYIRAAWGNRGTPVSARQANEVRAVPLD
jgi:mono/diheme cytochrome c family protein